MASATLALACLLLIPSAEPDPGSVPDPVYLNERTVVFPVKFNQAKQAMMKWVKLYTQDKNGKEWKEVAAISPGKESFQFFAPEDGTYLFKVAVLGIDNISDPVDIFTAPVNKKIVIDTIPPVIRIQSVERKGEEVVVRWDFVEEHPDLASITLEYRPENLKVWTRVPITTPQSGQVSFPVSPVSPPVEVRMKMSDLAKNECPWVSAPVSGTAPPNNTVPTTTTTDGSGTNRLPPLGPPVASGKTDDLPGPKPTPGPIDSKPWSPSGPGPMERVGALVPSGPTLPVSPTPVSPGVAAGETGSRIPPSPPQEKIASTGVGIPGTTMGAAPVGPRRTERKMDPPQLTNKRRITLDYKVDNYGPSGIEEVKLFVTRDDGTTWQPLVDVSKEKINVPFVNDPSGKPPSLQRSLAVDLHEDGVYGFYLIVKSGAGIGKPDPHSGDLPMFRVEVDTTAPKASLIRPRLDPNHRDVLVLFWTAEDNNLSPKPITLEWAERKGAKWEIIGEGEMPNTGYYAWHVPAKVPNRVFLRLTVRDLAGNVSVAETDEPILVDMSEPEVTSIHLGGSSPR